MTPSCKRLIAAAACLFAAGGAGRAELVLSAFTGATVDENSDVRLRQSNTDITFHDARFNGEDFQNPVYYGARIAYFLDRDKSGFGFGAEFIHAKVYLQTGDTLNATGTLNGNPVNGPTQVSSVITDFNNSHGLNFLTGDALYRWVLGERGKDFLGHIQPYAGGGIGIVVPHVESVINGVSYGEYQIHGPAFQAIAGLNFQLTHHWSIFTEYKFTYADLTEDIPGGSISFTPEIHHFVSGISYGF